MSSLKGVKPGDELVLVPRFMNNSEKPEPGPKVVTVYKAGRTLVHILRYPDVGPGGGTDTYEIESGRSRYANDTKKLMRYADYLEELKRHQLTKALRSREIEIGLHGRPDLSTATLEALLAALDADTAAPAAPEFTPGEYEALFDAARILNSQRALLNERLDPREQEHLTSAAAKLRAHIKRTPDQEN
ncbi:hypothetical protein ACFQ6C_25825 [Streptomyces sp. NPDC056454]|uniref:beta barrel domain-containing protein n=1 Tax=Streptomyces sp. NPDC056454 TaxID=3345823 RepID=UPI00368CD1FD